MAPHTTRSHRSRFMTRFRSVPPLLLVAFLTSGCDARARSDGEAPPFNLTATRALITQQNKAFCEAHIRGDVAAIDSMFLPSARSYPPGATAAIGRPAIHALTVDFLKGGISGCREETTHFNGNAEYVIDEGTYFMEYGSEVVERGTYVNVWRQVNGRWQIDANIWNADPPVATPK